MKGLRILLVLMVTAATLQATVPLQASSTEFYEVPKEITIKRPAKNKPLAQWVGPVKFTHGSHATHDSCDSCHHKESDKNLGEFLSCTQCHNDEDPNVETGFYLAWHNHSEHSCMGCHRLVRLQDDKLMPPISCTNGCHKKQ